MKNIFHKARKSNVEYKTLCALPWVHLDILPDGKVLHCCLTQRYDAFAGDINKQSIAEIWNSEYMKAIRSKMIQGEEPIECTTCYEKERISGTSLRISYNKTFESKLKEIPEITRKDGRVDKLDLRHWHFQFNNLCNFKCRICGPDASSAWIPDAKKLGWLDNGASDRPTKIEKVGQLTSLDFFLKNIHTIEQISFAGGEPLMVDENWKILDYLDEHKRYDIRLSFNSNLSILKYKNRDALDYWKKWGRRVSVFPSIDEIDDRAELLRRGTNWKNIEENLKAVSNIGIVVEPYITVSAMNVGRLPEILDRLIDLGVIKGENGDYRNFELNILYSSPIFHVSILPDDIRLEIRQRLESYAEEFEKKYNTTIRDRFAHVLWHLEKPWHEKNSLDFKEFTKTLDTIRGENTLAVIPELACVLK